MTESQHNLPPLDDLQRFFSTYVQIGENYLIEIKKAVDISPSNFNEINQKLSRMIEIAKEQR